MLASPMRLSHATNNPGGALRSARGKHRQCIRIALHGTRAHTMHTAPCVPIVRQCARTIKARAW
eukprot:2326924-Pyramimonas_sp.AAC.1